MRNYTLNTHITSVSIHKYMKYLKLLNIHRARLKAIGVRGQGCFFGFVIEMLVLFVLNFRYMPTMGPWIA